MDGSLAEDRALAHLLAQGLKLVARNYRSRRGELDLVMRDGPAVVVVEVRARARSDFGSAPESVDARKQRRIVLATRMLLAQRPDLAECPLRFDIVGVDGAGRIQWLRDAFDVSE
ncbi:MAG: YraN family protein [Gammaproteobacteria bacterium]|nr:YraN family protein [Gammaproteobacteria bacterium]